MGNLTATLLEANCSSRPEVGLHSATIKRRDHNACMLAKGMRMRSGDSSTVARRYPHAQHSWAKNMLGNLCGIVSCVSCVVYACIRPCHKETLYVKSRHVLALNGSVKVARCEEGCHARTIDSITNRDGCVVTTPTAVA